MFIVILFNLDEEISNGDNDIHVALNDSLNFDGIVENIDIGEGNNEKNGNSSNVLIGNNRQIILKNYVNKRNKINSNINKRQLRNRKNDTCLI